jgi:hypothetical protein
VWSIQQRSARLSSIGSTFHDRVAAGDQEFRRYCREIEVVLRASQLRREVFNALWPDAPPEDDERIEAELAPRYREA